MWTTVWLLGAVLASVVLVVQTVFGKLQYRRKLKVALLRRQPVPFVPVSVNFHFTRRCNYECGFCFHTSKTSHLTPLHEAKHGLSLLRDEGMKKLNLSGGEPFLHPKYVGEIAKFCKENLKLESVSIVSNGSKIKKEFFQVYGHYVDILAISVDSFDEETNYRIGRGRGNHLDHMEKIAGWCRDFGIKFKLNTVVCHHNCKEDMNEAIQRLQPFRWKCFQVLLVENENSGNGTLRDVRPFAITDEEFEQFCQRHQNQKSFVPESNRLMKNSYLILDEYMKFISKGSVCKASESILKVPVRAALDDVCYEEDMFLERGGIYDWTRNTDLGCTTNGTKYDW